jgi:pimeloyl-ACP methyl ester carboxylesterase/class 3 adenylate cyclase/DNA-binding CsgD family transcriptional regulator
LGHLKRTGPAQAASGVIQRERFAMRRETRYAKSDGLNIAYQVVGHGPIDLVFVMGWVTHLDWFWEEPRFRRFLERLSSFARVILFDKRGTGLSDRPTGSPSLEVRMDDVRAVMDAVGCTRAALIGVSEGGAMSALFAATYPERTTALMLVGGFPRRVWAPDYPWAPTLEERDRFIEAVARQWGGPVLVEIRAPSAADDAQFREWWATYLRMSASPGAALELSRMNTEIDIRHVLPAIRVPTLIIHRRGDRTIAVENGQYLGEHIPGARYVELDGDDHLPFVGDQDAILDEIERFLTGMEPVRQPDRVLATILCTEIVGAMGMASRLGDEAWRRLLDGHDRVTKTQLQRFRGREVGRSVAGIVAVFDGPARAVQCASAILQETEALGLGLRAGLHCGEVDLPAGDLTGVAYQISARVMTRAEAGQVIVSRTVTDLVAGSGIDFEPIDGTLATGGGRTQALYRVERGNERFGASSRLAGVDREMPGAVPLSPREAEVAILIGRGYSNRQIADDLSISVATVERHAANIFTKLGVRSRSQVAVWVVEQGLLSTQAGPGEPGMMRRRGEEG